MYGRGNECNGLDLFGAEEKKYTQFGVIKNLDAVKFTGWPFLWGIAHK